MEAELKRLKVDACNVQESDSLQVEVEASPPEHLAEALSQAKIGLARTKVEVIIDKEGGAHTLNG